jgi:hypothetical protein
MLEKGGSNIGTANDEFLKNLIWEDKWSTLWTLISSTDAMKKVHFSP